MRRPAIAAMLGIATALLASGCMWGHVYDAETGLDVPGATVSWVDAHGNSGSETTGLFWAPGLYAFCSESEYYSVPHYNPVTFTVTAPGYAPLVAHRNLSWDDGPYDGGTPTCDNLWDIQDFSLMPLPGTSGLPAHTPVPTPTTTLTVAHPTTPTPTPTPKPGFMVR
jgi:hypothetical protein